MKYIKKKIGEVWSHGEAERSYVPCRERYMRSMRSRKVIISGRIKFLEIEIFSHEKFLGVFCIFGRKKRVRAGISKRKYEMKGVISKR